MKSQNPNAIKPMCHNIDFGTYQNDICVKTPWGTDASIEICMLPEIKHLWNLGIKTANSCCGHDGKIASMICVADEDIERMDALGYERIPSAPHCHIAKSGTSTPTTHKNVQWFRQHTFATDYAFCKTKEDLCKTYSELTGGKELTLDNCLGACRSLTGQEDNSLTVLIFVDCEKLQSVNRILPALVHEITHLKQEILESVCEEKIGKETESYMMQEFMNDAICALDQWYPELFR